MALRASDDANVVEINQNEGRFPTFIGADGLGDLHLGSHLSSVNDTVTVIADMGDKRRSEVLDEDEPEPSEARFKSARGVRFNIKRYLCQRYLCQRCLLD